MILPFSVCTEINRASSPEPTSSLEPAVSFSGDVVSDERISDEGVSGEVVSGDVESLLQDESTLAVAINKKYIAFFSS